ncbi:hypothetical protein K469DRAFT_674812 [Zopfia rhizophila CBS 207.26]|uniref:Cohesin loading factor-domain-containing protein n=1 Tax=Zopfia rhizophila CBS 207.26 TaxID=1314779 RepID=A0A6A6DI02_9PEZI|nr:hypothetical protein K469DRAFT_674812 [Zopfia rhizophila CBS 207.26]
MDHRSQWPPQGPPNGQYGPPRNANGYQPNGYQVPQYPQQSMPQGYPQSQQVSNNPRVVIQQRPSQYPPIQDEIRVQPRAVQPQVATPARNPNPMAQMQNPRIRQVQIPVQRPAQRTNGSTSQRNSIQARSAQTPVSKPVQQSQSYQENPVRSQHRPPNQPSLSQHRAPLQPQSTPQRRTPQRRTPSQTSSSQHRTPVEQQATSQQRSHPQVIIKRSTPQSLSAPTKAQHAPPARALPVDQSVLLLSMADEYVAAARGMGPLAAMAQREADLNRYYKLMATGLGCMETILKRFNLAPRKEAQLRLRYASLLIEETENNVEIEDVLIKGLSLCQRSHLTDLKYSLLHLQARYQFMSSHRAALKSLDQPISEAETFQHIAWVYAFRFLKVSLALQVAGRPETASALQQLHAISNHAERRGDRAIFVTCAALEAMIHLRAPGPDNIEQAQRAIGAARSLQLQTSVQQLGQIVMLIDYLDLSCSLKHGAPDVEKMKALQIKVDTLQKNANGKSGPDIHNFSVLIERSSGGNTTDTTGGIFRKSADGRDELNFSWLSNEDLYALTYYISGLTSLLHNHDRGLSYLQEGLKLNRDNLRLERSATGTIPASINRSSWRITLDWQYRFVLGLLACKQEDWLTAETTLVSLRNQLGNTPFNNTGSFNHLVTYLSGTLDQGRGSIDQALATYGAPVFALPDAGVTFSDFNTDIAILATMNRLLIVRHPAHAEHFLTALLFSQLEPLCANHPNQIFAGAFRILRALTTSEDSINRQKTLISNALSAAQKLQNQQFTTICLTYMTSKFFADTIGDQAIKGARAARSVAKQSRNALWRAVACGLCINTFQRHGLLEDAAHVQREFEAICDKLPPPLKGESVVKDEDGDYEMEE